MTFDTNGVVAKSDRYARLAAVFRPIFERIGEGAANREAHRTLPHAEVKLLKEARFGALRVPVSEGGHGANLIDLLELVEELAAVDSNIVQVLRSHFGFVENLLLSPEGEWRDRWMYHVVQGDLFSAGWTEGGAASSAGFSTNVSERSGRWVLSGRKAYTTGGLFSDWYDVGAVRDDGATVGVIVSTHASGVTILDDWNGFGQALTASGTTLFHEVEVDLADITPISARASYQMSFYQLYHLAALSGIGKGGLDAFVNYLRQRKRTYSHGAAPLARNDPQVLQLLGQVQVKVHVAQVLTSAAVQALQVVHDSIRGGGDPDIASLDIQTYQAQVAVSENILEATTITFNGLGASALDRGLGLDRFWRNARAISSHNPVIYKERIVGDYVVNGTAPPKSWLSGPG